MRISDWSSDVCSSDLFGATLGDQVVLVDGWWRGRLVGHGFESIVWNAGAASAAPARERNGYTASERFDPASSPDLRLASTNSSRSPSSTFCVSERSMPVRRRSEEHTSELQSLMRISYAVFCLKKKKQ